MQPKLTQDALWTMPSTVSKHMRGDIMRQISESANQISGSWSTNSPTYGCHKTYTLTIDVKDFYVNMNEITIGTIYFHI